MSEQHVTVDNEGRWVLELIRELLLKSNLDFELISRAELRVLRGTGQVESEQFAAKLANTPEDEQPTSKPTGVNFCFYCEKEYPRSETRCPYCNTPSYYRGVTHEGRSPKPRAELRVLRGARQAEREQRRYENEIIAALFAEAAND